MWFFKKKAIDRIEEKVDEISSEMDKMKIAEYVEMIEHPRRMLWANFIVGLIRGFGMAIGFTILGAIILYALRWVVQLNLPLIGEFIAELVKIVQENMSK